MKPCEVCDELTEQSRCASHRPKPAPTPNTKAKAAEYDNTWRRLSERARRAQPFCLWCTSTEDLQLDHTPTAWARKAAGKSIRLQDVRVLCGDCNREAGQARPGPGQRTSEDRPEPIAFVSPSGRNLTPGGITRTLGDSTRGGRQSFCNTPQGYAQDAVVDPW